ncbi:MAG TPA: DUF1801 domain-containing protein [Anaerolineales bacterium]|nr:DUF1801 domain-containing protein [Anaerolineales bacterium]
MKDIETSSIDDYIAGFPTDLQMILQKVRQTIREAAPDAKEKIAYGIPTFTLEGNLVHFAAFKEHIGFYPDPRGIDEFINKLARYRSGKGTIQFPLNEPIPYDLIREVTLWRVSDNLRRAAEKKKK